MGLGAFGNEFFGDNRTLTDARLRATLESVAALRAGVPPQTRVLLAYGGRGSMWGSEQHKATQFDQAYRSPDLVQQPMVIYIYIYTYILVSLSIYIHI